MKIKNSSFLGLMVGAVSLYIFIRYFFDWQQTKLILSQARISLIIIAASGFVFAYLLRAFKWTYILRCREDISWRNGYHTTMLSSLANFALPVRFGEVLRLFIAKKTSGVSYAASTAASMIDLFTLAFFILFFLFLTPLIGFDLPAWASNLDTVFFVFLAVSVFIFVLGARASKHIAGMLQRFLSLFGLKQPRIDNILNGKINNFFQNILTQCQFSSFTGPNIFIIALLSVMTICTDGFYFYFLISAFGLSISYFKAILAACFLNVFFFIPSPPVRVGTAEMYPVLIFSGIFLLPSEVISTAAILWHVLTTAIISALGIYSMVSLGLQLKTVLNFSSDSREDVGS